MKATTQARHVLRLRLRGKGNSGFRIRAILPSMSVSCSCNVRCKQTLSCLGEMSTVIINMYFKVLRYRRGIGSPMALRIRE